MPGARTVLLDGVTDPRGLHRRTRRWDIRRAHHGDGAAVEIPIRYDGPDLAEVAALWGVAADEVVRLHSATTFRVAFCGFAPGFGYLTGLPARLHVPRRATPGPGAGRRGRAGRPVQPVLPALHARRLAADRHHARTPPDPLWDPAP